MPESLRQTQRKAGLTPYGAKSQFHAIPPAAFPDPPNYPRGHVHPKNPVRTLSYPTENPADTASISGLPREDRWSEPDASLRPPGIRAFFFGILPGFDWSSYNNVSVESSLLFSPFQGLYRFSDRSAASGLSLLKKCNQTKGKIKFLFHHLQPVENTSFKKFQFKTVSFSQISDSRWNC